MKVVSFGVGSIGKRHIKILRDIFNCQVFAFRSGKSTVPSIKGIRQIYTWKEVKYIKPDVAFIMNPTFLHIDTAIKCARLGIRLFIEKPLDCSQKHLDVLIKEIKKRKLTTYLAYNLRFHPVITYLKNYLQNKKIFHASVYSSSYLPYWRKNTSHLKYYSAFAKNGGGVILDLSHEFDYIDYLFNGIKSMTGVFDKASAITVDSEDFMDAFIKTKETYVNLHLNFLSLHNERTIKIDHDGGFIFADLLTNTIELRNRNNNTIKKFNTGIEHTYFKEIEYFFKNINNYKMMNNVIRASELFRKILTFKEKP